MAVHFLKGFREKDRHGGNYVRRGGHGETYRDPELDG
jgi:hypothetical protein